MPATPGSLSPSITIYQATAKNCHLNIFATFKSEAPVSLSLPYFHPYSMTCFPLTNSKPLGPVFSVSPHALLKLFSGKQNLLEIALKNYKYLIILFSFSGCLLNRVLTLPAHVISLPCSQRKLAVTRTEFSNWREQWARNTNENSQKKSKELKMNYTCNLVLVLGRQNGPETADK